MKIFIQLSSFALILFILSLASCSKDDGEILLEKINCQTTAISSIQIDDDGNGNTSEFVSDVLITYDTNSNIASVKEDAEQEECTGASCTTDADIYETKLSYNRAKISNISFFENGVNSDDIIAQVTYDGDYLKTYKLSELSDGVVVDIDEYRFVYENERIVKIEEWEAESVGEPLAFDRSMEFTYDGDNVTSSKELDSNGGVIFERKATYDDKINPLKGQMAIYFSEITFDDIHQLMFLFSENNPISIESEHFVDSENSTANVVYEYNELGVPMSYVYTITGDINLVFNTIITNDCK